MFQLLFADFKTTDNEVLCDFVKPRDKKIINPLGSQSSCYDLKLLKNFSYT